MLLAGFVLHVNKSYELLCAPHSRNSNPHSHFAQSAACSLGFVSLKKKSHFPRAEWDFFSETDLFTKKRDHRMMISSDCRQSGARTVVLAPFFSVCSNRSPKMIKKSILSSLSYRFFEASLLVFLDSCRQR